MKFKAFLKLLILFALVSCATKNSPTQSKTDKIEGGFSSGHHDPSTESQSVDGANAGESLRKPKFGIWIDGAGFDSFMALGVIQELEKNNLVPSKIVGTGFGCWIALSWALNNSGNQAEWQSFKWKDWDLVKRENLLSRLGGGNAFQKTLGEVRKHFLKRTFRDYSLPVDCPFLRKTTPFTFQTARFVEVDRALATQLFMPFVEMNVHFDDDTAWYSGALGGIPTASELQDAAKEIIAKLKPDEMWVGWIVLKTRNFSDFGSDLKVFQEAQAYRSDEKGFESSSSEGKIFDLRKESLSFLSQNSDGVLKPDERRTWLLEGRRQASALIDKLKTDGFLKTELH